MPDTISLHQSQAVATVTLRRPEVHNALDPAMIRELTAAFRELSADAGTRVVVLAAEGKSFCAGADLNWMREAAGYTPEENLRDALALARMFNTIWHCPKPVIGRVQGAAFGGGVGLVAVCDLVAAHETATFCFSEVKLGLVPAVISPFVLRKLRPGEARRYFITAATLSSLDAFRCGLVAETAATGEELDRTVHSWTQALLKNGPEAIAEAKRLLDDLYGPITDAQLERAARSIAERRASTEGQEGVRAFLEKRAPSWRVQEDHPVP